MKEAGDNRRRLDSTFNKDVIGDVSSKTERSTIQRMVGWNRLHHLLELAKDERAMHRLNDSFDID